MKKQFLKLKSLITPTEGKSDQLFDWWLSTTIMAYIPFILCIIFSPFNQETVIHDMFINGDLIISSFIIITNSTIDIYKKRDPLNISSLHITIAFVLIAAEAGTYAAIQTSSNSNDTLALIYSIFSIFFALIIPYVNKNKLLKGEQLNEVHIG